MILKCSLLGSVLILSSGCVGKRDVAVVTATTIGIEVGAPPQDFVIGVKRFEGIIAPGAKDDQEHVPAMASFEGNFALPIGAAMGTTFATGNAAIIMAKYAGSSANVKMDEEIDIEGSYSKPHAYSPNEEKRRVVFGTMSNFGFHADYSTSAILSSFGLSWKRIEFGYLPQSNGANADIVVPSLLAASGTSTTVEQNSRRSKTSINQFIASGNAALYLAGKPEIRGFMGSRFGGGESGLKDAFQADLLDEELRNSGDLGLQIRNLVSTLKPLDSDGSKLKAAMVKSGFPPSDMSATDFDALANELGKYVISTTDENYNKKLEVLRNELKGELE